MFIVCLDTGQLLLEACFKKKGRGHPSSLKKKKKKKKKKKPPLPAGIVSFLARHMS